MSKVNKWLKMSMVMPNWLLGSVGLIFTIIGTLVGVIIMTTTVATTGDIGAVRQEIGVLRQDMGVLRQDMQQELWRLSDQNAAQTQQILDAMVALEKRMEQALINHRHLDDGSAVFTSPLQHDPVVPP